MRLMYPHHSGVDAEDIGAHDVAGVFDFQVGPQQNHLARLFLHRLPTGTGSILI